MESTQSGGTRPNAMIADPSMAGIERSPDPSNALRIIRNNTVRGGEVSMIMCVMISMYTCT